MSNPYSTGAIYGPVIRASDAEAIQFAISASLAGGDAWLDYVAVQAPEWFRVWQPGEIWAWYRGRDGESNGALLYRNGVPELWMIRDDSGVTDQYANGGWIGRVNLAPYPRN